MKVIGKIFFTGLLTVVPVVATVYLVLWVVSSLERFLGNQLKLLIPDELYHAGMGLLFALALIFVVGLLMRAYVFRQLIIFGEGALTRIPVVKSVYQALKDFFGLFSGADSGELLHVVSVQLPGSPMRLLGFITRSDFSDLTPEVAGPGDVAVYLPMSYQVGGYTVLVPRSSVTPVAMARDEAMRFVLTAGLKAQAKRTVGG